MNRYKGIYKRPEGGTESLGIVEAKNLQEARGGLLAHWGIDPKRLRVKKLKPKESKA